MVVTATYSDNSTEAVTGYTTSGFSSDTAGNKTITVTYEGKTATFTVDVIDPSKETVVTPTASPTAGEVAGGATVSLSTTTVGAEIWYTTDGTTPAKDGTGSTKYTTPIAITAAVTIKAIAVKDDMNDSAVLEAAYTIQSVVKTLTSIAVTTPPTKVQYNLNEAFDGTGMVVTATYSDNSTEAVTGYTTSGFSSDTAGNKTITITYEGKTATFTVDVIDPSKETVVTPTASPAAGEVAGGTTVTLSTTTTDAEIWYTTDGTTPAKDGTGSAKYTTPIAITAAVTIKAIAVKDGMNDSGELEAAYTIQSAANQTPVAGDYDISSNLTQTYGSVTAVTVTAKTGKSPGAVTVSYAGSGSTTYDKSTTAPTAAGTYTVTFSVAAATGWNAASDLAAGTLTISAKAVTITGLSAASKVYDGSAAATVSGTAVISGNADGANLTVTAGTAAFANKAVGAGKAVTFSGYSLSGTAAGNYTLSAQPAGVTANITALQLTIAAPTGTPTKVYDGTTAHTGTGITIGSLTNKVNGDTVNVSASTTYNSADVATASQIAIVYAISGADAANYTAPANDTIAATITRANPTVNWPTNLTAVYGQTLANVTLPGNGAGTAGSFSWTAGNTTSVGNAGTQSHNLTFTPTNTANYNTGAQNVNIAVAKATGAAVSAPTASPNNITANSVTLNAVTASTGQTVEYSRSNVDSTTTNGTWQAGTTFDGLSAGTTYYFFARAQENANYNVGAASVSAETITKQAGKLVFYWLNEQNKITFNPNTATLTAKETMTISADGSGYSVHSWYYNGVEDTSQTGQSYTFYSAGKAAGNYTISLLVEKNGAYYSANFTFTVEE
jgi:transcription elongation GreA/GreB family factor